MHNFKLKIDFDVDWEGRDKDGLIAYHLFKDPTQDKGKPDKIRWAKSSFEPTPEDIIMLILEGVLEEYRAQAGYKIEKANNGLVKNPIKNDVENNG